MSDETSNQNAERSPTPAASKVSGGVFSWLTGSRSPTYGTAPAPIETSMATTTTTTSGVRSNASGSPSASGNVSPARTASPVGSSSPASRGSRSPVSASSRSPPRSPARRFVVPALAMGMGGGGRGPAVMMDMGHRTVYVQSDDEQDQETEDFGAGGEITTITSTSEEMKLPPSVQITTKTVGGAPAENQLPEPPLTVRYATSSTAFGGDNQAGEGQYITSTTTTTGEPGTKTVRYVTKNEAGDNQTAHPAGGVRYITTTSSGADGGLGLPPLASPAGQGGVQSVRYITKTVASPAHTTTAAPPAGAGGVRYITKTVAVDGATGSQQRLLSPATPSPVAQTGTTNARFFGSPQQQPNVHYVTRVVNGQSVQVPVPVGAPTHDHRVHYVTAGGMAAASPSSSVSSTTSVSPSEHQHVRYIVKSNTPQMAVQPNQVQYVTTTTTAATGASGGNGGSGVAASTGVPLSAVVASTVASRNSTGNVALSPAHHTPASLLRLDSRLEGLPTRHFRGIALTDTDSSDEDAEVKMVFDIMQQKFVPVAKPRRRSKESAAAAAAAAAGAAVGAGDAAAAQVSVNANAAGTDVGPGAADAAADAVGFGVTAAANVKVDTELEEEKAAAPVTMGAATYTDDDVKAKGNGLAMGAAIGLTAAVAVGAAAAVASASASKPSPMMKLDTVTTPTAATVARSSPGGLKKRTPSQTKQEPSPRKSFFASAAANEGSLLPDQDVTIDMDASPTQYAELRSPSNGSPDGSRLGHIGMSLKVRTCRWLLITLLSLAIIVFFMILFYKGVTLRKYQSSDYSYDKQYDMLDNYNGYAGLIASLFSKPIELLVGIVVPILFFSFVAKALLGNKLSPRLLTVMFCMSSLLGFLLTNGFHAIYVQMRIKGVEPVIALSDLSLQLSAAAALSALVAANASSNASTIMAEGGAGNAITNTVLRNVVATPVEDASDATPVGSSSSRRLQTSSSGLLCSNTADYTNLLGTSELGSLTTLSTTTVATYGFPLRAWQEQMLPGALPETTVAITLDSKTPALGSISGLPMRVRTAANLFMHSAHIARDVFHWFGDDSSSPLGVEKVVTSKYSSVKTDTNGLTYVPLVELMNLTVSGSLAEETLAAPAFVSQVRTLFNQSLAGAANISRSESSLEFSSVTLPNGYAFESVTMEIPLAKSFLSRRLATAGSAFAEEPAPTIETDVFYDLDIANDCGPYGGACEVRRTEYDAEGRVYEPPTTIRAFALCNSSLGNDDLEVFFDEAQAKKTVSYTCQGKTDTGMLVVSVSSRIVGDAMIEGPSTLEPRLVAGMATLKNPRKVYSLTVGKLSWPKTNLALKFHAACSAGVGKCMGLDYALTAALENATEALSVGSSGSLRGVLTTALNDERNKEHEYLIVGGDFLPLKLVPTFAYNETETAKTTTTTTTTASKTVSGYPLLTITKPLQGDSLFQNDGDIVAAANFKSVNWTTTKPRTGASCSATVEARLNSVLNNHYYMDRGVQPAYTSAMYFLFQDAVMRTQIALANSASLSTLRFASTVEFMEMRASIPLLNVVLTLVGCAIILVISLLVAIRSARKKYSATEGGHDTYAYAPPESFARVKLDRVLFPWIVLKRRVVDMTATPTSTNTATTGSSSNKNANGVNGGGIVGGGDEGERIDAFTIGAVRLEHDHRDVAVDVPFTMGK